MSFSVYWSVLALLEADRVAKLGFDPPRVRAACARIDHALRRMARDLGESRDPGYRLWYEDVLGVYYRIDEDAMRVDILYCGPSRRR